MKWVEYIRGKICWQVIIVMAKGVFDYNEQYLGVPVRDFQYLSNGSTIWWRSALDELDKISNSIIEKAGDKKFLEKHKNDFVDFLINIRDITEDFRARDFTKLSDGQLIDMHKQILQIFFPFSGLTFYSVDSMDIKLEELILSRLRNLMKDTMGDDFNESILAKEYGVLTTPDELTYVNREELMINELAMKNIPAQTR